MFEYMLATSKVVIKHLSIIKPKSSKLYHYEKKSSYSFGNELQYQVLSTRANGASYVFYISMRLNVQFTHSWQFYITVII